jgi:diadenosine tetraphosphate (Ap4A) HIT family hydrolase
MSQEFTPKNLREPISCYEESTWLVNGSPEWENEIFAVWMDKFPVTPGHMLWIPKRNDVPFVRLTYGEAFEYGQNKVEAGEWTGFNIGQNIGIDAGQTILWPHIHLIPRHPSEEKNKGGIRRAIPNGDHKAYY